METPKFLSEADRSRVKKAVEQAESITSGEIRVYMEDECPDDYLGRAAFIFEKLGMTQTELRNGVLIYIAVKDHVLAIIGDSGIHVKVGELFWEEIKEQMMQRFKKGEYADGIVEAVHAAGKALSNYFPPNREDKNELPDDITFGEQ
jgi:uncharacterized membrane protein